MKRNACSGRRPRRSQKGIVLIVALIALVAITLAGIALVRSVDTGLLIMGNLSFKQTATQLAEAGIEQAVGWLESKSVDDLASDTTSTGYCLSVAATCNVQPVDGTSMLDGFSGEYRIVRLCEDAGKKEAGTRCTTFESLAGSDKSTKGGGAYGQLPLTGTSQYFYRITVNVLGPRDTESTVEAVVTF